MPPHVVARRSALALILSVLLLLTAPPASAMPHPDDWELPARGTQPVREFAAPPAPWAAGHRGVKLSATPGMPIRTPEAGTVSFSGKVVNREVLSIDHGGGYVSSFEPVDSSLEVGDRVSQGQVVARLARYDDGSFACDEPCFHWGVRHRGEYINPMLLVGPVEPSVLLPTGG